MQGGGQAKRNQTQKTKNLWCSCLHRFTLTTVARAGIDSVYGVVCNPEAYPRVIPHHYPSVRVMSVRGNTSVAEEHVRMSKCELVLMAKHVSLPPYRHETFVIGGDAKGMHVVHDLKEANSSGIMDTYNTDDSLCDRGVRNNDDDMHCFSSGSECLDAAVDTDAPITTGAAAATADAADVPDIVTVITTTITQRPSRLSVIGRIKRRPRPEMASFANIMRDLANAAACDPL